MSQGNGFKDPIAIKERESGKEPWSFKAPVFDRRTSRNISAGDNYGSGHRQPVGHEGNPKPVVDVLPLKSRMFKSDL